MRHSQQIFGSPQSSDRQYEYINGSKGQTKEVLCVSSFEIHTVWPGHALPGHISREGPHAFQEVGTIAALHILHDHAEVFPGLEAAVHGHHEGIVGEGHDVPLGKDLLHLHATILKLLKILVTILPPQNTGGGNITDICAITLTINVPVVYTARDVMILMRANPFREPGPYNGPSNGFAPSKSLIQSAI